MCSKDNEQNMSDSRSRERMMLRDLEATNPPEMLVSGQCNEDGCVEIRKLKGFPKEAELQVKVTKMVAVDTWKMRSSKKIQVQIPERTQEVESGTVGKEV